MRIIFDDLAEREYDDTIEYYEIEIKGLGERFKAEIKINESPSGFFF